MRRPLKNISFQKGTGGSVETIVAVTGRTPTLGFFFHLRFFSSVQRQFAFQFSLIAKNQL